MCICVAESRMSNTLIYIGEAHKQGQNVHVLAYQNVAINEASTPNAMILPFPSVSPLTEENVIDTRPFKNFLKDITNATKYKARTLGMVACASTCQEAKVFDVGSYTVVLARHVSQIPKALEFVPEHKRPNISTRFLFNYGKMYKGHSIAVCCWDGSIEAEPLLWWYVPQNKDILFAPTMDAHNGNPPDTESIVDVDYAISAGSSIIPNGMRVTYTDSIPRDIIELLPHRVHGYRSERDRQKNGDSFIDTELVRKKRIGALIKRGLNLSKIDTEEPMYGWAMYH